MREQRAGQISAASAATDMQRNAARARSGSGAWRAGVVAALAGMPFAAIAQTVDDGSGLLAAFHTVRLLVYVAVVLGLAAGLGLFLYRRQRLLRHSVPAGLIVAVLTAVFSLWLMTFTLSSADADRCVEAPLRSGAAAQAYDLYCAEAREHAANALGLVSLARWIEDERQRDLPVGPTATRGWPLVSAALAALLGFLLLRPLLQRLFIIV